MSAAAGAIETVDFQAPDAALRFVRSLEATGFALVDRPPIAGDDLERLYEAWLGFFRGTDKRSYVADPRAPVPQGGYWPPEVSETAVGHSARDLKEFFHVVPGGGLPPALRDGIEAYRQRALDFARVLLGWLHEQAPADVLSRFPAPLPSLLSEQHSVLRVVHYPPLAGGEPAGAVRAAAHQDINLLTLLPLAREPGLEVLDGAGRWHALHGRPGQFVINAGDMLAEATGGYFPSTTHRVVNPTGEGRHRSRLALPFFLAPRLDLVLSERYTAGSYLEERLRAIGGATEPSHAAETPS